MSESSSVEQRLMLLEREVAAIKRRIGWEESSGNWIEQIAGSFKNDPEFEEILRLGQAIRESDQPKDDED